MHVDDKYEYRTKCKKKNVGLQVQATQKATDSRHAQDSARFLYIKQQDLRFNWKQTIYDLVSQMKTV